MIIKILDIGTKLIITKYEDFDTVDLIHEAHKQYRLDTIKSYFRFSKIYNILEKRLTENELKILNDGF